MEPKQIAQKRVDAFNQGDEGRISEFYSDNAIKHQVASSSVKMA